MAAPARPPAPGRISIKSWPRCVNSRTTKPCWCNRENPSVSCARRHFGGSVAGRLVVTAGLGGMGGAQPLAATMNGAAFLGVEVNPARIERRLQTGYIDHLSEDLDEALHSVLGAKEKRQPL